MDNNKHLSEETIALAAESLVNTSFKNFAPTIRQHIAECDQCAHEVQMVAELLEESTQKPFINSSTNSSIDIKSLRSKRSTPAFLIAASISLAIIASTIFIWIENDKVSNKIPTLSGLNEIENLYERTFTQETIDSLENLTKNTPKKNKTKENNSTEQNLRKEEVLLTYQAHPKMETLSNRFKNDAAHRGFGIEIITKSELKVESDKFQLNWNNPEATPLTIEIFDNNAKKILELESDSNTCEIASPKSKGLYYWKLLDDDFELIFCGRILIE